MTENYWGQRGAGVCLPLTRVALLHRIGELDAGTRIMSAGVSGAHHAAAFSAANHTMDLLKTRAPF